jgi:hypothetical protein
MAESRRKFDQDFREGAVRIVRETGRPIAQVARVSRVAYGAAMAPGTAPWARTSAPSWCGCGGRTPSSRWSAMFSNARSPSG